MQPIKIAAIAAVLAAAGTYIAKPSEYCPPEVPAKVNVAVAREKPITIVTPVRYFAPSVRASVADRNVFAYVVERVREEPVRAVVANIEPPAQPGPSLTLGMTEVKFSWRYIGRFGHAHDPIAAFERDGEVVTVRRGERIDAEFHLREIGLESAVVQLTARGATQTIPLRAR